jgi:hypothetical protein
LEQPALAPVILMAAGADAVPQQYPQPVVERAALVERLRVREYLMDQIRVAGHPGTLRTQAYFDQIPVRGKRFQKSQRPTDQVDTVAQEWEYAWSSAHCPISG